MVRERPRQATSRDAHVRQKNIFFLRLRVSRARLSLVVGVLIWTIPVAPPRHMVVFFMQSIMVEIFFLVTNRNFRYFFIDFVSIFWYQFDICVGATPARDEYGCSPGRLREGTSLAAFDLGAGKDYVRWRSW